MSRNKSLASWWVAEIRLPIGGRHPHHHGRNHSHEDQQRQPDHVTPQPDPPGRNALFGEQRNGQRHCWRVNVDKPKTMPATTRVPSVNSHSRPSRTVAQNLSQEQTVQQQARSREPTSFVPDEPQQPPPADAPPAMVRRQRFHGGDILLTVCRPPEPPAYEVQLAAEPQLSQSGVDGQQHQAEHAVRRKMRGVVRHLTVPVTLAWPHTLQTTVPTYPATRPTAAGARPAKRTRPTQTLRRRLTGQGAKPLPSTAAAPGTNSNHVSPVSAATSNAPPATASPVLAANTRQAVTGNARWNANVPNSNLPALRSVTYCLERAGRNGIPRPRAAPARADRGAPPSRCGRGAVRAVGVFRRGAAPRAGSARQRSPAASAQTTCWEKFSRASASVNEAGARQLDESSGRACLCAARQAPCSPG